MKKFDVKELMPGMVLAEDVFVSENKIPLFEKGDILSSKDIARLTFYSVNEVSVETQPVQSTPAPPPDLPNLHKETRSKRIQASKEFREFKQDFENCTEKYAHTLNDILAKNKEFELDELMTPIYQLMSKNKNTNSVFDMLHNLRQYDDATYAHCINVALISNILAQWLRYDKDEIELATQAGLFHDIGKLMIPDSIIKKKTKLTAEEYDEIKKHPQIGYDCIKEFPLSNHVKNAVLMHHERCDGTGYPSKLTGPQMDKFAKLIAIADVYDAMTSARYYRGPLCPFIAIATFEEDGFQKYDSEMILTFLQNIVNTYISDTVRLNTGEVGEIIFINRNNLSKPTIKIGNQYIDLSKTHNVYIEEIL